MALQTAITWASLKMEASCLQCNIIVVIVVVCVLVESEEKDSFHSHVSQVRVLLSDVLHLVVVVVVHSHVIQCDRITVQQCQ